MKINAIYLSVILTIGGINLVYADCKQSSPVTAPDLMVNMSDALSLGNDANWQLSTQYPGSFDCSRPPLLRSNKVGNSSPFTKNKMYIGFNNGKDYVQVTVTGITPSGDITLKSGHHSASEVQAQFTLNAKRLASKPSGNIMMVSDNKARLDSAVIAMDTTNFSLLQAIVRFTVDFLTFVLTWHWPSHPEDIYYQPVLMTLDHHETTCDFTNAGLTVHLPQVDRAQLLAAGINGDTAFKIDLACNFLPSGKTTRAIKVYLSSNTLRTDDNKTMIDKNKDAPQGVGIRLRKTENNIPITFSTSQVPSSGTTLLLAQEANSAMQKSLSINLNAYYYVYDAKKLSTGSINTTSILNFEYN